MCGCVGYSQAKTNPVNPLLDFYKALHISSSNFAAHINITTTSSVHHPWPIFQVVRILLALPRRSLTLQSPCGVNLWLTQATNNKGWPALTSLQTGTAHFRSADSGPPKTTKRHRVLTRFSWPQRERCLMRISNRFSLIPFSPVSATVSLVRVIPCHALGPCRISFN